MDMLELGKLVVGKAIGDMHYGTPDVKEIFGEKAEVVYSLRIRMDGSSAPLDAMIQHKQYTNKILVFVGCEGIRAALPLLQGDKEIAEEVEALEGLLVNTVDSKNIFHFAYSYDNRCLGIISIGLKD